LHISRFFLTKLLKPAKEARNRQRTSIGRKIRVAMKPKLIKHKDCTFRASLSQSFLNQQKKPATGSERRLVEK